MKKVTVRVVLVLVAIVVLVLVVGMLLPSAYHVQRSVVISAPASDLHPRIADLKRWPEWTTWNTTNYPNLKYRYEGADAGVGAAQSWTDDSGNGRLEITRSSVESGIEYTMQFEGFSAMHGAIKLEPQADGTKVTWSGDGEMGGNPIARYFGLMMDAMLGADLEKSLAGLKAAAESSAPGSSGTGDASGADPPPANNGGGATGDNPPPTRDDGDTSGDGAGDRGNHL